MKVVNIKNALKARCQNWQSQHYEFTRAGRDIANLKNSHSGERCFIIGNGPSLTVEDLQVLHQNNVATFASNRIFNIFDNTEWRPTYYASEDIIVLRDIQKDIEKIPAQKRFIPINLKWYESVDVKNANYFYMDYTSELTDSYGISLDVAHSIRCKGTVTITCIQFAIHMGFSEIYLLGVDHNYSKMINEKGEVVEDTSVKDYFSEKYDVGIKTQLTHDMGNATKAFYDVECLSNKTKTFRVFNATRGGKLEVFERVDFDKIF